MIDKTEYFESEKIYNYYGTLAIYKQGKRCFIELGNWDKPSTQEITQDLYNLLKEEVCSEKYWRL